MTDGSTDAGEFFRIDVQGPSTSNFIARNLHSDSYTRYYYANIGRKSQKFLESFDSQLKTILFDFKILLPRQYSPISKISNCLNENLIVFVIY